MALFQQSVLNKYLSGVHEQQADDLKSQIAQNDAEIDGMVYELYGLTGEEIEGVEGVKIS